MMNCVLIGDNGALSIVPMVRHLSRQALPTFWTHLTPNALPELLKIEGVDALCQRISTGHSMANDSNGIQGIYNDDAKLAIEQFVENIIELEKRFSHVSR